MRVAVEEEAGAGGASAVAEPGGGGGGGEDEKVNGSGQGICGGRELERQQFGVWIPDIQPAIKRR